MMSQHDDLPAAQRFFTTIGKADSIRMIQVYRAANNDTDSPARMQDLATDSHDVVSGDNLGADRKDQVGIHVNSFCHWPFALRRWIR